MDINELRPYVESFHCFLATESKIKFSIRLKTHYMIMASVKFKRRFHSMLFANEGIRKKQDCSYQGEALNVPTAFECLRSSNNQ